MQLWVGLLIIMGAGDNVIQEGSNMKVVLVTVG
jgi:hypothetical protein